MIIETIQTYLSQSSQVLLDFGDADSPGGMMGGMMGAWGWGMWFGLIFFILVVVLLVVLIIRIIPQGEQPRSYELRRIEEKLERLERKLEEEK